MDEKIVKSIKYSDAIIFMKIGRHFEKIIRIIKNLNFYNQLFWLNMIQCQMKKLKN